MVIPLPPLVLEVLGLLAKVFDALAHSARVAPSTGAHPSRPARDPRPCPARRAALPAEPPQHGRRRRLVREHGCDGRAVSAGRPPAARWQAPCRMTFAPTLRPATSCSRSPTMTRNMPSAWSPRHSSEPASASLTRRVRARRTYLDELERAVLGCRFAVVVPSPAFEADLLSQFQAVVAQHLSLEDVKRCDSGALSPPHPTGSPRRRACSARLPGR
jgi:hypothetical protein